MLKMKESELRGEFAVDHSSANIFNLLSELPGSIEDADFLFDMALKVAPSITDALISSLRWAVF